MRGSPRVTAVRATEQVVRDAKEKEGGHGRRPCEENESSGLVARTSYAVAESRKAASGPKYARTQRSKKSGGASERGPRSARRSARERRWPRRAKGRAVRRHHRCETGDDRPRPRMTRERHSAVVTSPKRRCGSRGTGAVRATGSYEGSPTVEGIPDRHEPQSFTRRWSSGLGGFLTQS